MTDEMIALARRAVACTGFRWMPGMRILNPAVPRAAPHIVLWDHGAEWPFLRCSCSDQVRSTALPDLSDPATLGCLLALVREAWGDRYASVWCDTQFSTWEDRWVYSVDGTTKTGFSTEAEALVAALEAAP